MDEIVFIGSADGNYECSWAEFEVLADFEYDSGYGSQEVASDLIVVFNDGTQMRRREYNGDEGWYLQKPFKRKAGAFKIKRLFASSDFWRPTVKDLNFQ